MGRKKYKYKLYVKVFKDRCLVKKKLSWLHSRDGYPQRLYALTRKEWKFQFKKTKSGEG